MARARSSSLSPSLPSVPLTIDPEPSPDVLTSFAGLSLVAQTLQSLGVLESVQRNVQIKSRQRGFTEAQLVQSIVLLMASGGRCAADMKRLLQDPGLPALIGHALPSPETTLKFVKAFHEEALVQAARAQREPGQLAFIPAESDPLQGLAQVNHELIAALCSQLADQRIATVDQDATILQSRNRNAEWTYQGVTGYQPMVAMWAELGVALCDEFRDGNVPAAMKPLVVCQHAFSVLPKHVTTYYYRADSASYDRELLAWLRDEKREGGPQGPIGFCISARMSPALHRAVLAVPESDWKPYRAPGQTADAHREVAEVPYVPEEPGEPSKANPLRYVAVRIRPRQGELFADGTALKHFAVVSNQWDWDAAKLLQWHREKAGTIEPLHDEVKNELGGGLLPSQDFGHNAAWFRLALLTHNVLVALKRLALPPELVQARAKRLRFEVLWQAGRLIHHARSLVLRISTKFREVIARLVQARKALLAIAAPS
jgi:Transposase DDE domain group 1